MLAWVQSLVAAYSCALADGDGVAVVLLKGLLSLTLVFLFDAADALLVLLPVGPILLGNVRQLHLRMPLVLLLALLAQALLKSGFVVGILRFKGRRLFHIEPSVIIVSLVF